MTSITSAGSTLGISASLPATYDADGFGDVVFTTIGGIEKIGTFGATAAKVEFQPLSGGKEKHKGSIDYGTLNPSLAHDKADAGQTLLRTACAEGNNNEYSYCITFPNGDQRFSVGRAFGYPEDVEGADSIVMANPTIELNKPIVKVDAA